MEKYLLISNGYTIACIRRTDNNNDKLHFNAFLTHYYSWNCDDAHTPLGESYVANVYVKFDGDSHWNFYGEDYPVGTDADSYYNIGDLHGFIEYMQMMWFVYECANMHYERLWQKNDKTHCNLLEKARQEYPEIWLNNAMFKELRIEKIDCADDDIKKEIRNFNERYIE